MVKASYIHVPFCEEICAYCDFTRCRYHTRLAQKWLVALEDEVTSKMKQACLETLYIGGGTPSALSTSQLETMFQILAPYHPSLEYTMEANVESLSDAKIALCVQYGVNRISLGVQTLQPALLKTIARRHTKEDVVERLAALHTFGLHDISIDLIYGLPGQTMEMWKTDLAYIVKYFDITHISLYALTIEEHSTFGRMHVKNIDSQIEADMYEYAISFLQEHGFIQYEISNFSKVGKQSLHNQIYWKYENFYGIGCGASGKENHVRYDNTKNLQTYFDKGPSSELIPLNREQEMFETIMMGLRLCEGLNYEVFNEQFEIVFLEYYQEELKRLLDKKLLVMDGTWIKTTYEGMLLLNDVLMEFLK